MSRRVPVATLPTAEIEPPEADTADPVDRAVAQAPIAAALAGLVGVYVLAVTSILFAPEGSEVAVWWPAAGFAVAMLVLAPRRWQWLLGLSTGVALATGLASFTAERDLVPAAGLGISNGAGAYVAAWLLTRGHDGRPSLRTMDDLWRFLSAALAGSLVAAVGTGLTVAYGLDAPLVRSAAAVMAAQAAAILVITPLAMRVGPAWSTVRGAEVVAQWVLLLGSVGYIFSPDQVLSLSFLPLPLVAWAALRFGLRMVTYQLISVGVLVTALTAAGGGPFAAGARAGITTELSAASLGQAFVIVTALIALPLAVAVDQRRTALTRLTQNEELFHKSFSESFVGMLLLYLDSDGLRIRELNQTAADMLGGTLEAFEGRPLQPLFDTRTSFKEVADRMVDGDLPGWREELWVNSEPARRVGLALSPMSTSAEEPMFSAQLMDVTDVYVATTRLETEKDFTEAVLSTTACPIVVVDLEGRITGLNEAGQKASGRTEEELLDQPIWGTLAPDADKRQLGDLIDRTRPNRKTPTFEGDLLTADGGRRRIVWSSAPLTNDTGRRTHVVLTGIDVTDERNVRSMTNHLLDAATSTAFIGVDLLGTITVFNSGAQELLGYSADEVTGRLRLEALHDPDEIALVAVEQQTQAGFPTLIAGTGSGPQTRDWTYVRADGSRVACAVTMSAVRDAFGSHIGYLAVAHDVTETRRSQRILVETLEREREAAEQVKNEFVSTVSHELRTPLTSIVGYTEMLKEGAAGPVSPSQANLLEAVRRNGERLIEVTEDLLTLSQMDAGAFTMDKTAVDLRDVFEKAHEKLEPLLVGRDLDVGYDIVDHPVVVLGDPTQLERVVVSLLTNAVKFTEDGGHVRWTLSAADTVAEIHVRDTGIGIPEAERPQLFNRFFRSSTARERAIQGTGLGLAIAQSIVRDHDGDIWVDSRERVGTDVRVTLPLMSARHRLGSGF